MMSSNAQLKSEIDSKSTSDDINYSEWVNKYKPHINPNDPSDYVFQILEVDLKIVSAYKPNQVWTLISESVDIDLIVPGKLNVNKMGYYVTEIPWGEEDKNIEVKIDIFEDKRSLISLYRQAFDAEKENVYQNFNLDVDSYDDLDLLINHLSLFDTPMNSVLLALKTHEIPLYMMLI